MIGTRLVSYIVYLTDPERPWSSAVDGGALELYPVRAVGDALPDDCIAVGVG